MKLISDFKLGEKFSDKNLEKYLEAFKKREQGFLSYLDENQSDLEKIHDYITENADKYQYIVVLGIGGSALGTIALRDALVPKIERQYLRVIDNVDPEFVRDSIFDLDYKKTLFVVVTKSGGTVETMGLYFLLKNKVTKLGLDYKKHFTFITDPKSGVLRDISKKENIPTFDVPENIGGRFSVLTPVSLLPLGLMGVDINSIAESARKFSQLILSSKVDENIAFQYAMFQYENIQRGKNINVVFPYSSNLKTFGEWYSQLLAESIGKVNKEGVSIGLTPVTAIGATDQHSQLQLYAQGPDDKIYTFIKINKFRYDYEIYEHFLGDGLEKEKFSIIANIKLSNLLNAELEGTYRSLEEIDRPICSIELDKIEEKNLGELIVFFEASVALLGEILEINAFDQPGVERSKIITKEILKSSMK